MINKLDIFCTLGPSTLNKKFLKFAKGKISLLRLNMSHVNLKELKKNIIFIKKNTNIPICVDTEGAQIRTKIIKKKKLKINDQFKFFKKKSENHLYPYDVYDKLKIRDYLSIGFDDLVAKIISKNSEFITLKVTSSGLLEDNKGIHLINRFIKLDFLTKKDLSAIEIAKKMNIRNFALSFTNNAEDIKRFKKILPTQTKIYKIESKHAVKTFNKLIRIGDNFLIDRGDLSKEMSIENIPYIQRKILKKSQEYKNKNIFIATNFLESMITNKFPTRGEANDIYSSLEMGAKGIVLAAETAIGHYPEESVNFLKKMILAYKKKKI
jgi:pyruvate kinase